MAAIPAPGSVAPILPSGKLVLKYLFGVRFSDGSEYFQTPDDASPFTPGKNSLYELLQCDTNGQPLQHPETWRLLTRQGIDVFQMEGQGWKYLVDLRDGHFEVGQSARGRAGYGAPFFVQVPPAGQKLHLVYFRRRRHHTKVNAIVRDDHTPEVTSLEDGGQECEYHFGWISEDGKHQATLVLV